MNVPPLFTNCEINRSLIKLERLLGGGQFGDVYFSQLKSYSVAVKVCKPMANQTELVEEAKQMHKLSHKRIVKFYGICTQPASQPIYLITEYMSHGNLHSKLKKCKENHNVLEWHKLVSIIDQVCKLL